MPMQGRTSNKLPCSDRGLKLAPVVDDLSHLYICRGSSSSGVSSNSTPVMGVSYLTHS